MGCSSSSSCFLFSAVLAGDAGFVGETGAAALAVETGAALTGDAGAAAFVGEAGAALLGDEGVAGFVGDAGAAAGFFDLSIFCFDRRKREVW